MLRGGNRPTHHGSFFCLKHLRLQSSLGQHRFGEFVGQLELMDDREQINAGSTSHAEDLRDDGLTSIVATGKTKHLDDDAVFGDDPLRTGIAHRNCTLELVAVDPHETVIAPLEVTPDECLRPAREDFDHAPAPLAAIPCAEQLHQHLIAGVSVFHIFGEDVERLIRLKGRRIVRPEVPVPLPRSFDRPRDRVRRRGRSHQLVAPHQQPTVRDESFNRILEPLVVVLAQPQLLCQLLRPERL